MQLRAFIRRYVLDPGPSQQIAIAGLCLLAGLLLLPALIFMAGAALLGRYEGASLGHTYAAQFAGLGSGSTAAWIVVLGPYLLLQLYRGLRACWRAAAGPA